MLRIEKLARFDKGAIVDIDISVDKRTAVLLREGEGLSLVVDGWETRTWPIVEMPHLRRVRWIFENQVAVWLAQNAEQTAYGVFVYSEYGSRALSISAPHHIVGGMNVSYASYGEDRYLSAASDAIEANMVVSFDRNGKVLFGIKDLLRSRRWKDDPLEVSAACITEDDEMIVSFYGCPGLWMINQKTEQLSCIPGSCDIGHVTAVTEHDGTCVLCVMEVSKMRFCRFDRAKGLLVEDDKIEMDRLFPGAKSAPTFSPSTLIHGCPKGMLVAHTVDSAFVIELCA